MTIEIQAIKRCEEEMKIIEEQFLPLVIERYNKSLKIINTYNSKAKAVKENEVKEAMIEYNFALDLLKSTGKKFEVTEDGYIKSEGIHR